MEFCWRNLRVGLESSMFCRSDCGSVGVTGFVGVTAMQGSIRIQNVLHCCVRVASLGAFDLQWNVAYRSYCCRGMNQTPLLGAVLGV